MTADYQAFIAAKTRSHTGEPLPTDDIGEDLFGFQREITRRALERGRYAIFADCGLGKTLMELDWSEHVPGRTLILTPLGVTHQMEREAIRFGYTASRDPEGDIVIANYERLHHFDPQDFDALVLDESSILKAYDGKTRTRLIEFAAHMHYRLAATATPAPNDYMELGNHAEFLGVMTRAEMLAMFFVHDGGSTQDWRLKGHGKREFWRWVASWSCMMRMPSDMGFPDEGYDLPELRVHHHRVDGLERVGDALLPSATPLSLNDRRTARRGSLESRCKAAAALDDRSSQFLVWCDLNDESALATKLIPDAVEVKGADSSEHKEQALLGFANGDIRVLVSKPSIAGWGMNWQGCHRMAFLGMSDSYEAYYQAVRRCWRFGQTEPVDAYLIYSDIEACVVDNVLRKARQHEEMQRALLEEVQR